ncbi:MAG: hypothetical protein U1E59_20045 [Amaricoccus sp.]
MTQIILIGPIGAGKSTVARPPSKRLGLRQVPVDEVRRAHCYRTSCERGDTGRGLLY